MEELPSPLELERFIGSTIRVQVKDGRKLLGVLKQYDRYLNLVLEDVEEYAGDRLIARHKLVLLKGGNLQAIST